MTLRRLRADLCLALFCVGACTVPERREATIAPGPSPTPATARQLVAEAAASSAAWDVVGPHVLWSPLDCVAPPLPSAHASRAPGASAHGQKLYVLRSNDAATYLRRTGPDARSGDGEIPVGLALVKESYAPVAVDPASVPDSRAPRGLEIERGIFHPYAERDGTTYRTGEPRDLFVMVRVPPGTPDSERGWIYGTVTRAGEVTGAGPVASCVGCHREAGADSLFGVDFSR